MSYTFALIFAGGVLLTSGIRNQPIGELLSGIVQLGRAAGPAPGEGGLAAFLPTLAAVFPGVTSPAGPAARQNGAAGAAAGAWGGAKAIAYALTRGMPKGSQKRSTRSTASGGISDHWTGCKECYAVDVPAAGAAGDRIAATVMRRLGKTYAAGSALSTSVEYRGYRIQVLWRVADHYDHVHVGVRRLGYTP